MARKKKTPKPVSPYVGPDFKVGDKVVLARKNNDPNHPVLPVTCMRADIGATGTVTQVPYPFKAYDSEELKTYKDGTQVYLVGIEWDKTGKRHGQMDGGYETVWFDLVNAPHTPATCHYPHIHIAPGHIPHRMTSQVALIDKLAGICREKGMYTNDIDVMRGELLVCNTVKQFVETLKQWVILD